MAWLVLPPLLPLLRWFFREHAALCAARPGWRHNFMASSTTSELRGAPSARRPASADFVLHFFEWLKNKIARLPSQPTHKEFVYDAKDIFDKSANAKLKNKKALDEAGKLLEQNEFHLAVVATSATVGDTAKDRVLTEARAKVVRDYLVEHYKFDDTRLKIIGLGKSSKAGETGKVEILVYD